MDPPTYPFEETSFMNGPLEEYRNVSVRKISWSTVVFAKALQRFQWNIQKKTRMIVVIILGFKCIIQKKNNPLKRPVHLH